MNTCGRCGLSDEGVLDLDTGGAYHPELKHCITRLKAELEQARRDIEKKDEALDDANKNYIPMYSQWRIDHYYVLEAISQELSE